MPQFVQQVQPPLRYIPSTYSPSLIRLAHAALPLLLRFRTRPWLTAGITQIQVDHVKTLVSLIQQFQAGQTRLIMAFRHVEVEDPLLGLYLLSRAVPQAAREQNISLQKPLHTHFLYERGMPLWAGDWMGWFLSHIGGTPVRRGRRPDWKGLKEARQLLVNGKLPMTVAPEGATNGHSERLGPFEPGVAQMGFWAVEDLAAAGRAETVIIVPIGIRYRYVKPNWQRLDQLLTRLETDSGLAPQPIQLGANPPEKVFGPRLLRLGEHLVGRMEQFYARFSATKPDTNAAVNFTERLQRLLDTALETAERYFHLPPQGTMVDRCRRLEEAGWTAIYREDLPDLNHLSPLDRGLADWVAQEASLRLLHMRLVECFVAVDGTYIPARPTFERFAETTLLISDMLARIRGDKLPRRPRLGKRRVQMTVSDPISVTERWPTYGTSRQAARAAVQKLTQDLQTALEQLIDPSPGG